MFFQSRFLDLLFLICFRIVSKMVDVETPSKSDGVKHGFPNRPMGAKRHTQNISGTSLLHSRNNLAPETPPETHQVIFFMMFEGIWNFPGLMLKVFQ